MYLVQDGEGQDCPREEKSSRAVCNEVGKKYKTSLCARSIQRYYNNIITEESPKKRGPD